MTDSFERAFVGGRYRLGRLLDTGGSNAIYEAEDTRFGRRVAVKIPLDASGPDSVAAKRLAREARVSGAIGHPNVCEISDVGTLPNGTPFVVMERLVGETLRARLVRERRLDFSDLFDVMMQTLSGLGAAHELGITHRDMKPDNLFLVRRVGCAPLVKILDFGNAPADPPSSRGELAPPSSARAAFDAQLTATGIVVGTPNYLAPEQVHGTRDFDARVDVYACGVLLYEVTTGRLPFPATNLADLFREIAQAAPTPVSLLRRDAPPGLDDVIARAMAPAREARFANAYAFQSDLARVRSSSSGGTALALRSAGPHDISARSVEDTHVDDLALTNRALSRSRDEIVAEAEDDWADQPTVKKAPTPRRPPETK